MFCVFMLSRSSSPPRRSQRKKEQKHMQQKILTTVPQLIEAGGRASGGVTETAATITLVLNTKPAIDADTNALMDARDLHINANAELKVRFASLNSVKSASRDYIAAVRDTLKRTLGPKYSPVWDTTGFIGSFKIPTTTAGLKDRLHSLKTYLTNNPTMEVPAFDVTAARGTSLLQEVTAKDVAVAAQKASVGAALDTRRAKEVVLRRRLVSLMSELAQKIDPLDQRWTAFGFNKPGAKATPDVPTGVIVALIGPNAVAIKWNKAARAEYYRVWMKVNGADEEFVAKGSPSDLDFAIEGLPSGKTIQIAVSAVNNGGESQLGEKLSIVTP